MMKKYMITAILILLSVTIKASSADSLFEAANKAYSAGEYTTAQSLYQKLENSGFKTTEILYNLGNTFYKQNNLAKSILYFERAKRIKPNDKEINFNLQLARTYTIDKIDEIPPFFMQRWLKSVTLFLSYNVWYVLSILSFVLFTVLLLIYFFTGRFSLKKISFVSGVITLILSVSFFLFGNNRYNFQTAKNEAIIMTSNVTVKGSPDYSGTDLFVIHAGSKIILEDELAGWFKIKIADGNVGWIPGDNLEVI